MSITKNSFELSWAVEAVHSKYLSLLTTPSNNKQIQKQTFMENLNQFQAIELNTSKKNDHNIQYEIYSHLNIKRKQRPKQNQRIFFKKKKNSNKNQQQIQI